MLLVKNSKRLPLKFLHKNVQSYDSDSSGICRSAGVKSPPPEALLANRLNKKAKIDG